MSEPEREALDLVLRLLARRSHNRAELRRKGRTRGLDDAAIEAAIARAEELHLLEPEIESARQLARQRSARKGATPRAVEAKLRQRGYASDIAREAAREAFTGWDPHTAAGEVIDSERDPARAARKLQRLGFDADVIRQVVSRQRDDEQS